MLTNNNFFGHRRGIMAQWRFTPDSVNLAMMPVFHIAGAGLGDGRPVQRLHQRRDARRRPRGDPAGDPASIGITNAFLVPAVIQFLLDHAGRRRRRLLQPAGARLRRLADHRRRPEEGHGSVRLRIHPGVRPDRNQRRHLATRRRRPRSASTARSCCGRAASPTRGSRSASSTPTAATSGKGPSANSGCAGRRTWRATGTTPTATAATVTPDGWLKTGDAGYRRRRPATSTCTTGSRT